MQARNVLRAPSLYIILSDTWYHLTHSLTHQTYINTAKQHQKLQQYLEFFSAALRFLKNSPKFYTLIQL